MGNQPLNCRQYCGGDSNNKDTQDLSKPGNPIFEPFYENLHNNAQVTSATPNDMIHSNNVFEQVKLLKSSDIGNTLDIVNNQHAPPVTIARLLQTMPPINNIKVQATYRKIGGYEFSNKDSINNSYPVLGPFE